MDLGKVHVHFPVVQSKSFCFSNMHVKALMLFLWLLNVILKEGKRLATKRLTIAPVIMSTMSTN